MSFLLTTIIKPLAYISLPVVILRSIAHSYPQTRYYIRAGLYVTTLSAVATYAVVVAAGMSVLGRPYDVNFIIARSFYAVASRIMEIEVEVEGEEHLRVGASVLMSNHQSMVDVLILGKVIPKRTSIMAKKSLQFSPVGPFMSLSGAIFIDRSNNVSAIRSLTAAGELMKSQQVSLWIYPEGTRHLDKQNTMLPLKKGGFHLAIQAGLPIVPIVTENYWRLYHGGVFETGKIKVRVLPPISTSGLTNADIGDLTARVYDLMMSTLDEISHPTLSSTSSVKDGKLNASGPSSPAPPLLAIRSPQSLPLTPSKAPAPINVAPGIAQTQRVNSFASSDVSSPALSAMYLSSVASSENGAETEEDEGMVLVDRPESN